MQESSSGVMPHLFTAFLAVRRRRATFVQRRENQEEGGQLRKYMTQFSHEGTSYRETGMKSHQDLMEELMKTVEELKALTHEDSRFQMERFWLSVIDTNVEQPTLVTLLQNAQAYTRLRRPLFTEHLQSDLTPLS